MDFFIFKSGGNLHLMRQEDGKDMGQAPHLVDLLSWAFFEGVVGTSDCIYHSGDDHVQSDRPDKVTYGARDMLEERRRDCLSGALNLAAKAVDAHRKALIDWQDRLDEDSTAPDFDLQAWRKKNPMPDLNTLPTGAFFSSVAEWYNSCYYLTRAFWEHVTKEQGVVKTLQKEVETLRHRLLERGSTFR